MLWLFFIKQSYCFHLPNTTELVIIRCENAFHKITRKHLFTGASHLHQTIFFSRLIIQNFCFLPISLIKMMCWTAENSNISRRRCFPHPPLPKPKNRWAWQNARSGFWWDSSRPSKAPAYEGQRYWYNYSTNLGNQARILIVELLIWVRGPGTDKRAVLLCNLSLAV